MAMNREKAKGRKEGGHFVAIPHAIINSSNFRKMGGYAVKLLTQMIEQLRYVKGGGTKNNGDLCVSWSLMKGKGWRSKGTLQRARDELLHYGFIQLTRQGMATVKGKPNLYALTFLAIDECDGKLDVSPTRSPSGLWKNEASLFKTERKKNACIS
ncbi:hypothetical protein [Endozoicomonas sp.]|uniref:hypothetical protein n=1 Tax=Endozoicomonas sp. TaxID=1892382 RepID=UPI003AF87D09